MMIFIFFLFELRDLSRGHLVEIIERSTMLSRTIGETWMQPGLLLAVVRGMAVLSRIRSVICKREKGGEFSF